MPYKLIVFLLLLVNRCLPIYAQDSASLKILPLTKNRVALEYGIHLLADQDIIFSPFILKDATPVNIAVSFSHYGKFLQLAEISFDAFDPTYPNTFFYYSNPDSALTESIKNDFTFVKVNYGLGKRIISAEKHSLTVGGMSENTVIAKYYYAGNFSTFGYFASFGLSAWSTFSYYINYANHIKISAHFPLFAWTCRSPYLANDDMFIQNTESHKGVNTFFAYLHDGNIQTLNTLQQFNLKVEYLYNLSRRFDLGASYHFTLLHNANPVSLTSFQNSFNINTAIKF